MINKITIFLLQYRINKIQEKKNLDFIVEKAYKNMISNIKTTIMFLEAGSKN